MNSIFKTSHSVSGKTLIFVRDNCQIDIEYFQKTDHSSQAEFALGVLADLSGFMSIDAEEIFVDKLCEMYDLKRNN